MASVPSIKGSVFAGVVEDVAKLVDTRQLSREELARWLEPGDVAFLDECIAVAGWYDVRAYDRMNALLLEVVGGGDPAYFREQGRQTAKRLLEAGLYAQLEYLHRVQAARETEAAARFEAFGRDLRLLASLSGSILNFSRWQAAPDPDAELRYRLDVTEAAAMPESLCWRSDGFVNGMASIHGEADLWRWERPEPDHVVFRMVRPI